MLPWRIAVFTEKGATRIGLARPCGGSPNWVKAPKRRVFSMKS